MISDDSFGSVSGRFIEELLGIKEGGMIYKFFLISNFSVVIFKLFYHVFQFGYFFTFSAMFCNLFSFSFIFLLLLSQHFHFHIHARTSKNFYKSIPGFYKS